MFVRNSLFDFDFSAERAQLSTPAVKAKSLGDMLSEIPADGFYPEFEDDYNDWRESAERRDRLEAMAMDALDQNRMDVYFRILDSLEQYAPTASEPRPSAYGIPEVKLTYSREAKPTATARSSAESAEIFRKSYEPGEIDYRETFKVLYLDRDLRALGVQTVAAGGLDSVAVDVRVIFTGALLARAGSIIVCHNHPSGTLQPSVQDDTLTKRIKDCGELLNIKLLDHIILTDESYYSYKDEYRM